MLVLSQLGEAKPCRQGRLRHESQEVRTWRRKRPRLQSLDCYFSSPMEMPALVEIEGDECLVADGQFGAEICPRLVGDSEWDLSLCLAPHPQFLSSVLWVKMRWEPQKTLFREGGNCRWQTCVKHMRDRGSSPASMRNESLFFPSSHVSRSVSPTTTSQIQARKKRRGVSLIYIAQGGCAMSPSGARLFARAPCDILCMQRACP